MEYDGDVVVLHPGNGHVSVDGVPITEATRLPQGWNLESVFFSVRISTFIAGSCGHSGGPGKKEAPALKTSKGISFSFSA